MITTYETGANGGRTFASRSAGRVAGQARAWAKQGHEPHAFAIVDGDEGVVIVHVPVGSVRATTAALLAAK